MHTGWVLAAFFYGYILTQIPGGWLAERVGGKWVFGVGVVMTSLLTLFTPLAAFTNVWLLVAVRILEGFFEVCMKLIILYSYSKERASYLIISSHYFTITSENLRSGKILITRRVRTA